MKLVALTAAFVTWAALIDRAWGEAPSLPASPPLDSMAHRVTVCTPCHGKEGRATNDGYYPRIAGKPAGYLYNQLINFREGRRHNAMMTYLTQFQRPEYLQEISEFFASQELPYPAPQPATVDSSVLDRGRGLAAQGDPQQDIPACSSCHGTRLLGVAPAVPGLLGLSRDYLAAQLGAWRGGTRRAQPPDCMAEIVSRMSVADLTAVTAWLAAQPLPPDAAPEQSFERRPPLECGSIPTAQRTP